MFNQKLKKRKAIEHEIIVELKKQRVFSEPGDTLAPIDNSVIQKQVFEGLIGETCSILDIYLASLTNENPAKLKRALETHKDGDRPVNMHWIQLQDLISESMQHLGFETFTEGFLVASTPSPEQLKKQLRWHDIAVWQLVYNLYGNEFKAMPESEKYIYASVMKPCFDVDRKRALLLIGLLYKNKG